ncbi:Ribosome maturation protein SDO1 [uncultured archaeon]|nr:Ribosome maturation protein SDO1 [uncultured archaeon]
MTQTTARIKKKGKEFEILVDMDAAMNFKKGVSKSVDFLEIDRVFTDAKKGNVAPEKDLMECFGTSDAGDIAAEIVKNGEVLVTQKFRDEEMEKKYKQVVDFLVKNAIDPKTGLPHTPERIKSALEQSHVNIKNAPVETQVKEIMEAVSKIIPIKIAVKKVKLIIPAMHTGRAYGIVSQYITKEEWLNNGDLEVLVEVPAGAILDFYEKLNSVTHGSALSEEVKD